MAVLPPSIIIKPGPDPSLLGWPPTLPLEIAMRVAPTREICEAHGIGKAEWDELRAHPEFRRAVAEAVEALKTEGVSFKMKARLQAEELLKTSWALIHADAHEVPAHVKADLIKFTIKAAGLDASKEQVAGAQQNALQINIDLSGR